MLFVEPRFFAFFAVVFVAYWLLNGNGARKLLLLAASYVFYGAWDLRFLALLWFCTLFDFATGLAVDRATDPVRRRLLITGSVAVNLGVLFVFKYFNFFTSSFVALANSLGFSVSGPTVSIILPIGVSFYTFQSLSYTIDIYRGRMRARTSLLDYATFVAFFPQLVAGPIVRAHDFLPQLDSARRFADVAVRPAVVLFLFGFIKKACVSDNVAPYVDAVFAAPAEYSAGSIATGAVLYAIQIYCDFSGYTDMAIASAALLGYRLTENFRHPYFAPNIAEFWRCWHMSLSSWLRDYLYISLGGNRGGRARTLLNLMLTMVLGGLWHGASWNFVIWGALHGLALIAHREWRRWRGPAATEMSIGRAPGVAMTFWWVCLAWIFFRATALGDALVMAKAFVTLHAEGAWLLPAGVLPVIVLLGALHWLEKDRRISDALLRLPGLWFPAAAGGAAGLALAFVPLSYRPFIYFQF